MRMAYRLMAAALGTVLPFAALANECDPVKAAEAAKLKVPHMATVETVRPGQPATQGETVYIGNRMYTRLNGRPWVKTELSPETAATAADAAFARSQCQKAGEEDVGGTGTTVYSVRVENPGGSMTRRVWVSNHDGLPLKNEVKLANGMTITMSYRYGDIRPPEDAQ